MNHLSFSALYKQKHTATSIYNSLNRQYGGSGGANVNKWSA